MSLVLASKSNKKWLKKSENQMMPEKRVSLYFAVWRLEERVCSNTKDRTFLSLFDSMLPSISKSSQFKVFCVIILVLLTFRAGNTF